MHCIWVHWEIEREGGDEENCTEWWDQSQQRDELGMFEDVQKEEQGVLHATQIMLSLQQDVKDVIPRVILHLFIFFLLL